jgi:hypothetical protein
MVIDGKIIGQKTLAEVIVEWSVRETVLLDLQE